MTSTPTPNADDQVPPIERLIGHWFDGRAVHKVFIEDDGRQFILVKEETLVRLYDRYLEPGVTRGRRCAPTPISEAVRERAKPRAYHEAGHALICVDEGIKVEYVTIMFVVRNAWGKDRENAHRHLATKARAEGKQIDLEQELDRPLRVHVPGDPLLEELTFLRVHPRHVVTRG
jgi:hypothetical protein